MSSRFAALPIITTLALALTIPAVAYAADKTGSEGRAKTIEVNSPSADSYLQFHGRVFVTTGKTTNEYRWGGASCGSRTMSPELIQLLVDTVRDREEVKLIPTYQNGQGTTKCLVGFSIKNKEKGHNGGGKPKPKPR